MGGGGGGGGRRGGGDPEAERDRERVGGRRQPGIGGKSRVTVERSTGVYS